MTLKTILLILVTVILLGLCWLALDDITTGNEPNFRFEWAMVGLTVAWLAALGAMLRRRSAKPGRAA
jgi:hypothetical protein